MLHSINCRFQGPYTPQVSVDTQLFKPKLDFLTRLKRSFVCFMLGDKAWFLNFEWESLLGCHRKY